MKQLSFEEWLERHPELLEKPAHCSECDDKGDRECDSCDGRGKCYRCKHECDDCDGTGREQCSKCGENALYLAAKAKYSEVKIREAKLLESSLVRK